MIKWRHLLFAGVGGVACGKTAALLKDHPDITLPLLTSTAGSALVGVALGVGVAVYRKAPVHVYGLSVGANFAVCSFAFFGVRQVLLDQLKSLQQEPVTTAVEQPTTSTAVELQAVEQVTSSDTSHSRSPSQQLRYIASGTSGGVAGTLASLLSRHSVRMVAGTGAGGVVTGLLGQWTYSTFHTWRKRKAVELHYPELVPESRWTLKAFQDWFLGFWHRRSKVTRVESEIQLLENDIAEEEERIAALDQELTGSKSKLVQAQGHLDSKTDSSHTVGT